MTGPDRASVPGSLRIRTAPGAAHPDDEPLALGPDETGRLESNGPGRATLVADVRTAVRTPVLITSQASATTTGPGLVEVVVDGWRFELEVEPAGRAALRERASRDRGATASGVGAELRAIIPGRVVAVSVAPGDPVSAGQQLLVVEAMKMQNEVRSPLAGVVERLAVGEGQTIELGDLLVVIGEADRP
jgi:biotin carboxyl carrier protein